MYWLDPKLEELGDKVQAEHTDLFWIRLAGFQIGYLASDIEKRKGDRDVHAECIKVPELYRVLLPYDFLIVVYLPNMGYMSEKQRKILMYHELLHIDVTSRGDPKVRPHDVEDFHRILEQYGAHWDR